MTHIPMQGYFYAAVAVPPTDKYQSPFASLISSLITSVGCTVKPDGVDSWIVIVPDEISTVDVGVVPALELKIE